MMKTNPRAPRLVLRRALPPLQRLIQPTGQPPCFELTFACSGIPYKVLIRARNSQAAAAEGLLELAEQCPEFEPENARLMAAVQTL